VSEPERKWQRGGLSSGLAAGWIKDLPMRKRRRRSAPWSGLEVAGWLYRTGSPPCGGPGCCDPHRPALLPVLPASWRGSRQRSGCPGAKRGWKSLASDSSYPAGSGPWSQMPALQQGSWPWCVGNRGEAAVGGTRLPLCRVRCLSGRHPGSMPARGKGDGDVR